MTFALGIINPTGGVGKTTVTVNLGFALQRTGKKVLLIDLDQSKCMTEYLDNDSIYFDFKFLHNKIKDKIPSNPIKIGEHLDLLPWSIELTKEKEFPPLAGNEYLLTKALSRFPNYDFILIDCPPSMGLFGINVLVAAQEILIPVTTELMAIRPLKRFMDYAFDKVTYQSLNPDLKVWTILPTTYETRS